MIDLREHSDRIVQWLIDGLSRFRAEHPDVPSRHVALYCCPWSGWISLCSSPSVQLDQNCPDFEFVEYALYEAGEWAVQYQANDRLTVIDIDGVHCIVDAEVDGDDALNYVFFHFLHRLLTKPTTLDAIAGAEVLPEWIGVQLLDSKHGTYWKVQ